LVGGDAGEELTGKRLYPHVSWQVEAEDQAMTQFGTKGFIGATALLLASTGLVSAGGIERNPQTTAILFEEGTYLEFGYNYVSPRVSGTQVLPFPGSVVGSSSGDMAPAYSFSSLAYRTDITDALSFALILDEPIGADVDYTGLGATPGYLYRTGFGSQAELRSHQVTLAARYEMPNGFSVYGGARIVGFEGQVDLFNGTGGGAARYTLDAEASTEIGYMLGAAYERPDIAMRVALTYYSETNHDITASETTGLGTTPTTFQTAVPQQLLLEGQTGVAEGTLVFGSIRWTDWTEFMLSPPVYVAGVSSGRALVEYEKDVFTYVIGGARVLNDQWTLLGSLTYEAEQDVFSGNLGPTDGRTSIGIGARYTQGNMRITGGINYTWIGEAETQAPAPVPVGTQFSSFTGNSAIGVGLRVGFSF
jgi:long-chain fatty acid transport protein